MQKKLCSIQVSHMVRARELKKALIDHCFAIAGEHPLTYFKQEQASTGCAHITTFKGVDNLKPEKISNLWYGPPDQQPLEEVIKDMSLKEVKFFASDLFVPIYEDLDILDDSVKVEKDLTKEKLIERLDYMCFPYSKQDSAANLNKVLESGLRKRHALHDCIIRTLFYSK